MPLAPQALEGLDRAISEATPAEMVSLVIQISARLATLGASLAAPTEPAASGTENLSIDEGARQLGVSAAYLYRNAARLPFVVRVGRRRLVNAAALAAFNRQQAGR